MAQDFNERPPAGLLPIDFGKSSPLAPQFLYRDTFDAAERRLGFLLRPIINMLALAFVALSLWFVGFPPGDEMTLQFARANAFLFLILRFAIERISLPQKAARAVAAMSMIVAGAYFLFRVEISERPWGTLPLLLMILSAGYVFVSREWFVVLAGGFFGAWLWTARSHLGQELWLHMGWGMLLTIVCASWILETRLRSLREFEKKVAEEDFQRVVEETRFFTKQKSSTEWCPVCKELPDAVIRHDGEKILDANAAAARLLELSRAELVGADLETIFAKEKREDAKGFLKVAHPGPIETTVVRKNDFRVPALAFNHGKDGRMTLVLRDATERQRDKDRVATAKAWAQELLRRQNELAKASSDTQFFRRAAVGRVDNSVNQG